MSSHLGSDSKSCVSCGRIGWLLHMERILSASCMGWCLQASFKEHPKSMTIAYMGGASSIYLANFFFGHVSSRLANSGLIRAGGLISVGGIAWCLTIAFEEHPKAAIKACMAGALSICLAKSVIFGDLSASSEETSKESKATSREEPDARVLNDGCLPLPEESAKQVVDVGKELSAVADVFDRCSFGM